MSKVGIFLADGCEEIEALTQVDLLRRAGIEITMISVTGKGLITGSHGIRFEAEVLFEETDFSGFDGVILPGGLRGTEALKAHEGVNRIIREFAAAGKLVAAICAAPTVLGAAGLLKEKRATCYPGMEDGLFAQETVTTEKAVTDGCIITSRGAGTSVDFALALIRYLKGDALSADIAAKIVFS